MRRARAKPPRIRVLKHKPRRSSGAANQIHDEDVLRWRRMFSEEEALAAARLAGPGAAGLEICQASPALSPEQCSNALQYAGTLTEDARRAVLRHCEMVSRHERMLLEGQERLKFVQAQIKEMRAQMPDPPSTPWPRYPSQKGPEVTAEPLPEPSCWASCCGLFPLPPPPAPPPPPPSSTLAVRLPDESYFREAAARTAAEREWERERAAAAAEFLDGEGAASFSSSAPTPLEPVSGSVGGAGEATATAAAAAAAAAACDVHGHGHGHGHAHAVTPATLPGQLGGVTGGPPPAALQSAPSVCPFCAPTVAKGPGAPQSLLRPLTSGTSQPAVAAGGPLAAGASRASALPPLPQAPAADGADAAGSQAAPAAAAAPHPVSAAAADATAATAGAGADSQAALPSGDAAAAFDLSRYQHPDSIRKITQIQAAQRGRVARKQVADMRAQRQQPPHLHQQDQEAAGSTETAPVVAGPTPVAPPGAGATSMSGGGGSVRGCEGELTPDAPGPMSSLPPLPVAAAANQLAAPPTLPSLHPFASPVYGAGAKLPPLPGIGGGGGGATVGATAGAGGMDRPVYDLTPYQNPESISKITQIQAAQRGRVARKQVADMRAQRQQQQQQQRPQQQERPDGGNSNSQGGEGGVDAGALGAMGPGDAGEGGGAASRIEFGGAEPVANKDGGGGGGGALLAEPSF